MINSIFIAMSGMLGHERGLNVISNNVANMNTPGFRGSMVSFNDVFVGGAQGDSPNHQLAGQQNQGGGGVDASRTLLDLRAGDAQPTGRDLDLMLKGAGYFVLQDEAGNIRYSRDGSFDFKDGELLAQGQKFKVMTRDAGGKLVPMSIKGLDLNAPKPTSEVTFSGTLDASASVTEKVIDPVTVFDKLGGSHSLRMVLTRDTAPTLPAGAAINWKVEVFEGTQSLATGDLPFDVNQVLPGSSPLKLNLALKGSDAAEIAFNFDTVQTLSIPATLAVSKQDGLAAGTIVTQTFDALGQLKLTYTNGQTVQGPKLLLAQIRDEAALVAVGDSLLAYEGVEPVTLREAGEDLKVQAQTLERSNVDLTSEFSELILMQRGYQASSQVVSTANDMLQELLQMKGGR